jgi:hypothetical protein
LGMDHTTGQMVEGGTPENERRGIANQIFGEWWVIATTSLFETVDPDKAMEMMRPNIISQARKQGSWLKNELQLKGDSLMLIALNDKIGNIISDTPCIVEIAERGVVLTYVDSSSCFANVFEFSSALCQIHESWQQGICEAINPEYTAHFTQTFAQGHLTCKAVIRKKSVPLNEWENHGPIVALLLDQDMPEDLLEKGRIGFLRDMWFLTVQAFVDAIGDEKAMDILRPCMVKSGRAWGLKFADMLNAEKDEEGLAKLLEMISEVMQLEGDITVSPGRVDKAIGSCPFLNAPEEICRLFNSFIEGLCDSLEPHLAFTRKHMECPSKPLCHWTFKIPTEGGSLKPWYPFVKLEPLYI